MLLTAVVSKVELEALIASVTPLRFTIDQRRGRSVTLGRPVVDLAPGEGLRLRGEAGIAWDVAGVGIPVTIQAWQLLLVPRIVARGKSRVLLFEPIVEELDLKLVPGFFGDKIADAITSGIAQSRDRLAWDFSRTLSKRLPLSAKISPAKAFEILAVDGTVVISETELRLSVRFEACFERQGSVQDEAQQAPTSARFATAR